MIDGVKVIGLCGRSGCGKGYVSQVFQKYSIPSVDTDEVYRRLVSTNEKGSSPCLCELVSTFGKDILSKDGSLDRKTLSKIVFAEGNSHKLEMLNNITHKYILSETLRIIAAYASQGMREVIVDAPVLFESGFDRICDVTICVSAPDNVAVKRICQRDGQSEADAVRRLANQKSERELISLCDGVIVNDGCADVDSQVKIIVEELIRRD